MTMAVITELTLFQSLSINPNISHSKLVNRKEGITQIIAGVCGKGLKAALHTLFYKALQGYSQINLQGFFFFFKKSSSE